MNNARNEPTVPVVPQALSGQVVLIPAADPENPENVYWEASVLEPAIGDPRLQTQYRHWLASGLPIVLKTLPPDEFNKLLSPEARASQNGDIALSPVQQRVVNYFREASLAGASDIHINVTAGSASMEMRINGALYPVRSLTREDAISLLSTIYQSMCDLSDLNFKVHIPQDGRLKREYLKAAGLFGARYAHINTVGGVFAVMRLIVDDQRRPPSLPELGFLPEQVTLLEEIYARPSGVILNSGPTGSGKSTTARSLMHLWLERTRYRQRVITLEDPVEGAVYKAVQSPVIVDRADEDGISRAWARGRGAMVRLDPDLVFIGEIRDTESAMATINFAESGHISMSTQHASSPLGNIQRLRVLNVPEGFLQSSRLFAGLLAQRLLPVLCPHCSLTWEAVCSQASQYGLTALHRRVIERHFSDRERTSLRFIHRAGCPECIRSVMGGEVSQGITGRTVIAEVMRTTPALLRIYHEQGEDAARIYWKQNGGISMATHARRLALEAKVDPLMANELAPFADDTDDQEMLNTGGAHD